MKRNNYFSTSRLQLFLMLLAMVLLVACGNGKDKKSADDDEDETEVRAELEDDNDFDEDDFDVDDLDENDFDVDDIEEDDIDEEDFDEDDIDEDDIEDVEAGNSVLSVASLFDVFYKTLVTGDPEYCAKQLLAKGVTFDGDKRVEGIETYMMFSHPDYGEFYVGVTNEIPDLHVRYFADEVSEEEFFRVARSRGFREVDSGEYSDGKCTISQSVDGFFFRKK